MSNRAVPDVPWQQLTPTYRRVLRELGHTKQTYEKVQAADALVAEVNRSVRRRKGSIKYNVGFIAGPADYLWKRRR